MSKRLVTILWCIAGLLAALTLIVKSGQKKGNDAPTALSQGDVLLEDLPLKSIASIKIEDAENTVTLKKEETQWSVADRAGYEADFARLTRLLRSLTEVSIAQSRKAGPAFNERFGMNPDAESQDNHGTQVTFLNAEGEEVQSLSIGKTTSGEGSQASGKYIRLGSEPEAVYAVNDSLFDLSADPSEWLNGTFFAVNGIKSIALDPKKDTSVQGWTMNRLNAGSDFTIENLAAGRKPLADKLTPLKNILSSPRFEDVLSEEEAKEQRNESEARTLILKTFDGFTYTLDYAPTKPADAESESAASAYILKVAVTANLPAEREMKEGETEEEAKKADADFAAIQEALKDKLAKEQAFEGRSYRVADYVLSSINVGLDTLTEAKEEAVAAPIPQPSFGPLAPQPPLSPQERGTQAKPTTAVSPPIAIPPTAAPATDPTPEEKPAAEDGSNNADALNVLSDEDIQRIVEQAREAEESSQ
ncbi:MAG: DUF4340 domain-containing protein [Roseibacillus sp.]